MEDKFSPTTPKELEALLKSVSERPNGKDPREYRYALYVRKSTDEKDKQARSLPDQIADCLQYANDLGLTVMKPYLCESRSAKYPDIRPTFRQMINDIKVGKYDGILAWHPDRLARNMKDAGEIIDLIDKDIIKDLKFKTFNFDNSPSGKMHLGITFVISKQYSDHLSESVSRGNRKSVEEGKYVGGITPHGYYKDDQQYLRPDGENHIVIQEAFRLRLQGKSCNEIAEYMRDAGYTRLSANGTRFATKVMKQTVEKMIKNPVYAGVLRYGERNITNLCDHYDFYPVVTVEDYMKINAVDEKGLLRLAGKYTPQKAVKALLMMGMVVCDHCDEKMSGGISKGKTKKYFYYRCDTVECPYYGKSTRARVILNHIDQYLSSNPFSSMESYTHYKEEMQRVSKERLKDADSKLRSLRIELVKVKEQIERAKNLILEQDTDDIRDMFKSDLVKKKEHAKSIEKEVDALERFVASGRDSVVTYEKFLELMERMARIIGETENMEQKDEMIRKVFLNFSIRDKNVVKTTLRSPFDRLETSKVSRSGR